MTQAKNAIMEQRILKLLLIQLKLVALFFVAAMLFFLFVGFSPAKRSETKPCKHSCVVNEKSEEVREDFLIGKLFSYTTLETE
jgi:hypothetical protein